MNSEMRTSPRFLQACYKCGINPEELEPRSFNDFFVSGDLIERQKLRFNHFESRRMEKLSTVLEERQSVLKISPVVQRDAFDPAALIDVLISQEARKLESHVRSKLKLIEVLEKENADQVKREESLKILDNIREAKRLNSLELAAQRAAGVKSQRENRFAARAIQAAIMANSTAEKQSKLRKELEEPQMPADFIKQKAKNMLKADLVGWDDRMKIVRSRQNEKDREWEDNRAHLLSKLQNQEHFVRKKAEEGAKERKLRSEENSLRMLDAFDRRNRMNRLRQNRQKDLELKLSEQEEKLKALLLAQIEVTRQRKAISSDHDSLRNSIIRLKLK